MIFINKVNYNELEIYKQKGAIIIDLRPYNEYSFFHIPQSLSSHNFSVLPKKQPVIFVCKHGHLAKEFSNYYRRYNYECYYLEGGISFYETMTNGHNYY